MAHRTLISAADALTLTGAVWLDCRFDLADPGAGRRAHGDGHLPGAHYLHLDDDLSGDKHDGEGRFRGRHPLPDRAAWAALAGRLGVAPGVQVVAYDAQGGPYAARAWWLLRWLGHAEVAVLDGGVAAWRAAGGAMATDAPSPGSGAPYPATPAPAMPVIDAESLQATLGTVRLVDARAPERFRGEVEPLDAAAGHIPGAGNFFFKNNLAADGRFKTAEDLQRAWAPWVDGQRRVIHQCGSGVTACHNLLAMAHAGLGDSVLYPGSWSEWSSDPARPVAVG